MDKIETIKTKLKVAISEATKNEVNSTQFKSSMMEERGRKEGLQYALSIIEGGEK